MPRPLEEPEGVDERRRSVGLPPLAVYAEELRKLYEGPTKPAP